MAIHRLPIERRLLWMSLLATSAALLLSTTSMLTYDRLNFRSTLRNRLMSFADIVGQNSASAILFNDPVAAKRNLESMRLRQSITDAAIYTPQNKLFARWSRQSTAADMLPLPFASDDKSHFWGNGIEIFHPIVFDGSRICTVYIRSDLSEQSHRTRRYLLILAVVTGISFLLAAGVSLPLGRQISRPILELVQTARRVSEEQDYSVRAQATAGAELTLLVNTFNEMLSRIQLSGQALKKAHDELEEKVTERTAELKRKEEELSQSRRIESVGRLAAGVAHDFNNLLTGILGCSEALEMELEPGNALRIEVDEIKRAAERASTLTRQLLAFGRKQIISPRPIDFNAQIRTTIKLLRRLIGEDIEISTDLQPELGIVHADPSQIDQLVINLAVNARDAMPKGGKLLIKTERIRKEAEYEPVELKSGEYILLSISDTGLGMSLETQRQIFEPFFTTKELGKGTGLGLATVYGIVKQNGGAIDVFSREGLGTTFKIFLPEGNAETPFPESSAEVRPPADGAHARERILVVEDEALVSSHVARLLKRKGYTVIVTHNAEEALKAVTSGGKRVDLVLSDVIMPGMNGRQLIDHLRARFPDLPVLFMSGYPAEVIARHGVLELGIAFIEKPFYSEQMTSKIREVLDAARK